MAFFVPAATSGKPRSRRSGLCHDLEMNTEVTREQRLFGMLQYLMACYADSDTESHPPGPERPGVVERDDALAALLQVGVKVQMALDGRDLDQDELIFAAALLAVVRQYILSLPNPEEQYGNDDPVLPDLQGIVADLRAAEAEFRSEQ